MKLNLAFTPPDCEDEPLKSSPIAKLQPAPADGIIPDNYHATSNHPEYIKFDDATWVLTPESRMDAVFVVKDGTVDVVEARRLKEGQMGGAPVEPRTGKKGFMSITPALTSSMKTRINSPSAHAAPEKHLFPIPMTISTSSSNMIVSTVISSGYLVRQ